MNKEFDRESRGNKSEGNILIAYEILCSFQYKHRKRKFMAIKEKSFW